LGSNDGTCDDGGPGWEYDVCEYGTDCSDCGGRPPLLPPSLPPSEQRGLPSSLLLSTITHGDVVLAFLLGMGTCALLGLCACCALCYLRRCCSRDPPPPPPPRSCKNGGDHFVNFQSAVNFDDNDSDSGGVQMGVCGGDDGGSSSRAAPRGRARRPARKSFAPLGDEVSMMNPDEWLAE
jgi:hypothetical protein